MYCSKCGYQLDENDNFCPKCGNKVGSSVGNNVRMIRLKCQDCNGTLEIDEKREIATCPYCGSKNLIPESDNVKIERMRTNAYKDVEIGKANADVEKKKSDDRTYIMTFKYLLIAGAVMLIFLFIMCLINPGL